MLARPGTQVQVPVHSPTVQLAAQACTGLSGGSPPWFSRNPRDIGAALLPGAAKLSLLCRRFLARWCQQGREALAMLSCLARSLAGSVKACSSGSMTLQVSLASAPRGHRWGARLEFWIPNKNQMLQRRLALVDPKTRGSIS